jgi:uncharacterized protein
MVDGRAGLGDLWSRVTRWRVGWRWWALVACTLSLALVGVIVPLMTGGDLPSLDSFTRYSGIGAVTPVGIVAVALLANGLGEETGWRGFAADRLLRDHSSANHRHPAGACPDFDRVRRCHDRTGDRPVAAPQMATTAS